MTGHGKPPIGVDLFAGAGGLSLGFEQAGFEVAAAVEYDPIHAATHEYNFSGCATIYRSVADIGGDYIRSNSKIGKRDVDVVFGGAPCQGFSMIGKRALEDPQRTGYDDGTMEKKMPALSRPLWFIRIKGARKIHRAEASTQSIGAPLDRTLCGKQYDPTERTQGHKTTAIPVLACEACLKAAGYMPRPGNLWVNLATRAP